MQYACPSIERGHTVVEKVEHQIERSSPTAAVTGHTFLDRTHKNTGSLWMCQQITFLHRHMLAVAFLR